MSMNINENWYSIENINNIENIENREKIDNCIKEHEEILKSLDIQICSFKKDVYDKISILENENKALKEKIKDLEQIVNKINNENLKTLNRILETEISLERTKNSLIRKNIPFPFTPNPFDIKL